jgi:hypothetical protein
MWGAVWRRSDAQHCGLSAHGACMMQGTAAGTASRCSCMRHTWVSHTPGEGKASGAMLPVDTTKAGGPGQLPVPWLDRRVRVRGSQGPTFGSMSMRTARAQGHPSWLSLVRLLRNHVDRQPEECLLLWSSWNKTSCRHTPSCASTW